MNLPDDWRAALAAVGGPALDASWAELGAPSWPRSGRRTGCTRRTRG
jgi:hypothetical protein